MSQAADGDDAASAEEARRLAALAQCHILDSEDEEDFDAMTRLASLICQTPIALISLVDDKRQWFKSRVGLDARETPREQAFCAHAIHHAELMEVPDARQDPRFVDNPLVTGAPHIRFYAGMPLEMADDHRLGTLCVIDTQPRQLDERQRQALDELARVTVRLIGQRAERRAAQAREAMLDSLLEALPGGIVACDAEGQLTLFNSKARAWHGSDLLQVPSAQWSRHFDLYDADGKTLLPTPRIPLLRALSGEAVRDQEICIKAAGQPPRWVSTSGQAFFDARGKPAGAVVAMHDITERKRDKEEIADVRAYLQAVIDASTEVAMISADNEGVITLFNSGAERLLGYSAEQMVGKHTPAAFHLDEEIEQRAKELSEEWGEPISGFEVFVTHARRGHSENRLWTFVRQDGERRRVRLAISAIRQQGRITGFLGVATDLSQLHAMELALQMSEERFRTAFDTAPQGMALVSREGEWLEVNRTLCEMLGYSRDELLVTDFQTITHPDDLAADLTLVGQLLRDEIPYYQMPKRYFRRNGQMIWVLLSVSLVRDTQHRPHYFVSQIQDITEQRQLERMKNEFVAVVSHELRTPLTSINGALSLALGGVLGDVPERVKEMLTLAHRNTERLGHLVNDLLDLEKLAADKLAFDRQVQPLRDLLDDALASNRGYADSFGVVLALHDVENEDVWVEVDALRLGQVMANLLSNAIKFSPRGETVTVRYGIAESQVCVEVTDRGPGIPEEFRQRVFQHFAQAETGNTRSRGGTGLGLAISKQLVEHMQGQIGFDTMCDKGTTFWFRLPCASPPLKEES